MYKKKEMKNILLACEDFQIPGSKGVEKEINQSFLESRIPKFSKANKEVLRELHIKIIHSEKDYENARKSIEEILQIPHLDDKYHEIDIYNEDAFWKVVFEDGEELKSGNYGFRTDRVAFGEGTYPANVHLIKYKEKYIVYADEEMDESGECIENLDFLEHDVFDDYERAVRYFNSLLNSGKLSGKEQIQCCKAELKEADSIYIKPVFGLYDDVGFKIYYKRNLIMEHAGLNPKKINQAVDDFNKYCSENDISDICIEKERSRNSNQRFYRISFYDKDNQYQMFYVHIPSELQGRERNVINLIKPNNITENSF